MFKTICLAGLLAVCAGSVFAAARAVSFLIPAQMVPAQMVAPDAPVASLLLGAGLLAVALFSRRKRLPFR